MDNEQPVNNNLEATDGVVIQRDALTLDIDDKVFLETAKKLVKDSNSFFEDTYSLKTRREKNEAFRFGRQDKSTKFKKYNSQLVDNIVYEAESYIKPMALSRMPDLVVKPGNDTEQAKETARDISKILTTDLQSRQRRRILGMAFEHLPVYFVGIIKVFWNPEKGKHGDYDFTVVHPEYVTVDHTATTNDARDMGFINEVVEYSVKEWVMRFPDKEKEFYTALRGKQVFNDNKNENNDAGMNTKVRGNELWFTWYEKKGEEFQRVEGVAWYYENLLFKKMKSPNWDWEGETQTFTYEYKEAGDNKFSREKAPISEEQMRNSLLTGQPIEGMQEDQIFHNHLDYPEKPYIFLGYDQWGKMPYDETSRIEQAIPLQVDYDKRGRQITEILDRTRGKNLWSAVGGMKKEDLEDLDPNDPDQDLFASGNGSLSDAHKFLPGEQPNGAIVNDYMMKRERIFDKMGTHGPARGQVDSGTTATGNQISREGDFSRSDDLADDTINYAAEKMANWVLQFIKLRYTEDHMKRLLGPDGQTVFKAINRDLIDDGMEVAISASGTDKLKAEQRAMDMAKIKMIDPLSFFTDVGASDPKGRTEKLMLFMMQPDMYVQKFVMEQTTEGMANKLNGAIEGEQVQDSPQALQDIMQMQQGIIPPVPSQIDEAYGKTFMSFMEDPGGAESVMGQFPQIKEQLLAFAQAVTQLIAQTSQQTPPTGAIPPQGGNMGGSVGPVASPGGNPSPTNTSKVAITPPTGM